MDDTFITSQIPKADWILLYGSAELKYVNQAGYECDRQYRQERIKIEYPGFKFYNDKYLKELDRPSMAAIKQSRQWEHARVMRSRTHRELIVITNYLGRHTIVRPAKRTKFRWLIELSTIFGLSTFTWFVASLAYYLWQLNTSAIVTFIFGLISVVAYIVFFAFLCFVLVSVILFFMMCCVKLFNR
jgi:hypothetical protein